MNMSTADLFILSRMAQSLDKEVMTKVCKSNEFKGLKKYLFLGVD